MRRWLLGGGLAVAFVAGLLFGDAGVLQYGVREPAIACAGYLESAAEVRAGHPVPPDKDVVVELRPNSLFWYFCPHIVDASNSDPDAVPVYLVADDKLSRPPSIAPPR
jgi:hypothetical protein